jgi:hypothetical protein
MDPDSLLTGKVWKAPDNLVTDPNVVPLNTEFQREYTPKKADLEHPPKSKGWKYGLPIDPTTMYNTSYKAPADEDYPEIVHTQYKPLRKEPGSWGTTNNRVYVPPDKDLYDAGPRTADAVWTPGPPGDYDTEYRTKYLGDPTDPAIQYHQPVFPPGYRPTDYNSTHVRSYKPPLEEDYPDRVHAPNDPIKTGPLGQKDSTYTNHYKNPGGFDDPILRYRPKDSIGPVGPNAPWISHTHDIHDKKKCYCCACASH